MLCAGKFIAWPSWAAERGDSELTLCKACSWRKLVLGLLVNRVLALGDH